MRKLLYLLAFLPFLTACDNVSEDDRYIDMGDVVSQRNVLLEEFTGQRCTNCPDAHAVIEQLEHQYGDNLIVVSIHAGNFGIKAPYGLMQEEGDEYASRWGITAYPAGVVDRTGSVLDYNSFAAAVRTDMLKTTDLELSLKAQLSSDRKNIEVFTTMVTPQNLEGALQLWVVENGIVAFQIDGDINRTDYVHNNVFRACINGLWGENMSLRSNEVKYVSNEIAVDDTWNLDNIRIVGLYYNNAEGVIQVERCALD